MKIVIPSTRMGVEVPKVTRGQSEDPLSLYLVAYALPIVFNLEPRMVSTY